MSSAFDIQPQRVGEVEIHVVGDQDVTVVTVVTPDNTYVGTARRAPGDVRDPDFGTRIATQRALAKMAAALGANVAATLAEQDEKIKATQAAHARRWNVRAKQDAATRLNRLNPGLREARKLAREQNEKLADWERELLENRTP